MTRDSVLLFQTIRLLQAEIGELRQQITDLRDTLERIEQTGAMYSLGESDTDSDIESVDSRATAPF